MGYVAQLSRLFRMSAPATFEEWKRAYPRILGYLGTQSNSKGPSFARIFAQKRKGIHSRTIDSLSQFSVRLDEEITRISTKIESLKLEPLPAFLPLQYNKQRNMKCRILYFTATAGHANHRNYYESRREFLEEKRDDLLQIMRLYKRNLVPEDFVFTINDHFYSLEKPIDQNRLAEIDRLLAYSRRLESEIASFSIPLSVSNFPSFVQNLVSKTLPHFDEELGWFPHMKGEIQLSRAVCRSKTGQRVDSFIQKSIDTNWSQFSEAVVFVCRQLAADLILPDDTSQAIALMLFYRLIVDRVYETVPLFHAKVEYTNRLAEIRASEIQSMKLPSEFVPRCQGTECVRAVFEGDSQFAGPGRALDTLHFLINPLEVIIQFRNMMVQGHSLRLTQKLGREPTENELQMILAFDELFTMMLGSFLASDVVDVPPIGTIVKLLSPRGYMTPILEYSLVCIEAILMEIERKGGAEATETGA
jgi:hypothetical protein